MAVLKFLPFVLLLPMVAAHAQAPTQQSTARHKISSRVLREIDAAGTGGARVAGLQFDAKGRLLVELRCEVTDGLRSALRTAQATVVSALPDYRSVLAWVPVERIEDVAGNNAVSAIREAPRSALNRPKRNR